MSALKFLYGGQFTLSIKLIQLNYRSCNTPQNAAPQILLKLIPFITTVIRAQNKKELYGRPEQVDFPARQAGCKVSAN